MHQSDLLQIALIGLFRNIQAASKTNLIEAAEEALEVSLSDSNKFSSFYFHTATNSNSSLNFLQWCDWLKDKSASDIILCKLSDFKINRTSAKIGDQVIEDRYMAAFAGTHDNIVAVKCLNEWLGYRYQINFPAATLLTLAELLKFIEDHPSDKQHFYDSALWQNEHNLHFGAATTFEEFLTLLTPERIDQYIGTISITVSNVHVSPETQKDWWQLWTQKRNPAKPTHQLTGFVHSEELVGVKTVQSLSKQYAKLRSALVEILNYSKRKKLDQFSAAFEHAINLLDRKVDLNQKSPLRILKQIYSEPQARLFEALSACGVFGGMGSWNDLGLEEDNEYGEVSNRLFNTRLELLESCCNFSSASFGLSNAEPSFFTKLKGALLR